MFRIIENDTRSDVPRDDCASDTAIHTDRGWVSNSVKRVSENPDDKGLYIVTSYEDFFGPDLESDD